MSVLPYSNREELEADQLASLNQLFESIVPANRFYSNKYKHENIDLPFKNLNRFHELPFTTKQELIEDQKRNPPYGTNLTYPLNHYTRYHQTSGTTGDPLRWLDTSESWNHMLDVWQQIFEESGVKSGERVFFAFSFGPFIGFWMAFEAAERMGCLCIPGGGMNSTARLKTMIANQTSVLCCTPTYALRLAEVAVQENIDLKDTGVKTILVAGEPGGSIPSTKEKVETAWNGAKIKDHHGMTEVGAVSFESSIKENTLHIAEQAFIAEVVDPQSGQHVKEGESGELVLTTLKRTGSPLIRYRTGDLVKPVINEMTYRRPEIALDGGILGRIDDMVFVRGVNIYPVAVENVIRRFYEVAEYQVELHTNSSLTEMSLTIEPSDECMDHQGLKTRVEVEIRNAFHIRVPVNMAEKGSLPRFDMKAKRWIKK